MLRNKEKTIRVNTRVRQDQDKYIKDFVKKEKGAIYEGDVHRMAIDLFMKKYPLK